MTTRLLRGDCRATLPTLEPGSVQSAITSPPYYGLRDYGLLPLIWLPKNRHCTCGRKDFCLPSCGVHGDNEHVFGAEVRAPWANALPSAKSVTKRNNAYHESMGKTAGVFCQCGAWLGSLGLEPTPDLYIEHLVECFRRMRRVLRDDATVWVNLGDSYAGSGKGPTGWNGIGDQETRQGFVAKRGSTSQFLNRSVATHQGGDIRVPGLKAKDLMMMPFRVAMALQADGWWLRSVIPWLKRNSMPESVTDRPATSVEYVFLLAKSRTYYWDADAVRQPAPYGRRENTAGANAIWSRALAGSVDDVRRRPAGTTRGSDPDSGRSFRNSDLFFESWQGLMLDEQDAPLALVVNPQPFTGAHFATFPAKLVEPMIKASTRPGDTVLDPFGGAGTVGLVADRLQRNAILCELKADYADMGAERITGDAPMFAEVAD